MAGPKRRATAEIPRKKRESSPDAEAGKLLRAILDERGIRPTDFARLIGRNYHNVHRWFAGRQFTPENKGLCASRLGLPRDTFGPAIDPRPDELEVARSKQAIKVLRLFLRTRPIAAQLTGADLDVLRSIRFDRELPPSVALFEAVAFALRGAIRVDETLAVADQNERLDHTLAQKPPLKRRKKGGPTH